VYVKLEGRWIRTERDERALTGAEFAEKAGISRRTLTRVERNEGPVSLDTARKISRAIGVDPRTFARDISRRPDRTLARATSRCPA
jgi:transcriptional regulator with XRE-family HTH domain